MNRTARTLATAGCALALLAPAVPAAAAEPPRSPDARAAAPVPGLTYISFGPLPDRLVPVGDVDRNGSQDLLEVRDRRRDRTLPTSVQIAVRGGTTGRAAWSREVRAPREHDLGAFPAPVGRPAAPGVVLFDRVLSGNDAPPSERLTALDGRTGRTLWTRLETGREDARSTVSPAFPEDLDGALLVGRVEERKTDDRRPGSGAVRPVRLDLADGSVRALGALATSSRGVPTAAAVPDASGDGQRDVAVLTPGPAGTLQVRSGVDGATVWTSAPLDLWPDAQVLPVGALTAPGAGDLAVSTGTPLQADGSRVPGARGEVVLLAGRDGREVLRRPGDRAVALLGAGRPAAPALGVSRLDASSAPDGTATAVRTVTAYRPDGTEVYAATGTVTARGSGKPKPADEDTYAYEATVAVGDLDRDGALESFSALSAFGTDDSVDRQDWLDGATGARLPFSQRAEPLLGSLSSRGEDLVEVTTGNGVAVAGISGRTGRAAFRRTLFAGTRLETADVRAVPVTGSPCDDVAVAANGPKDDVAAVLRSDGTVRWSLRGPAGDPALRRPVLGPASTPRCS